MLRRDLPDASVLRLLRLVRGVSQSEAARRAGTTVARWWKVEAGEVQPTPDELARYFAALSSAEPPPVAPVQEAARTTDDPTASWTRLAESVEPPAPTPPRRTGRPR
jgi:transcriptional regulator with XRE-family HTH domain